ncbi:MAG: hypothetical protein KatS3mg103_1106 [Phycisphaerales bacterium]|nr:MAG: hypothetical protein KatS3mg103_1106 [Phycisphaerales bacterium]
MPWRCVLLACASIGPACTVALAQPVLVATDGAFGMPMVYRLDPDTGRALSAVDLRGTGPLGISPLAGLTLEPTGTLAGFTPTTDNALYRVDPSTGQARFGGRLGIATREGALTAAADGTIYAAGTSSPHRLFTIDPATGRASLGPTLDRPMDVSGLALRDDGMLVALDLRTAEQPASLRLIDPATGQSRQLAELDAPGPLADQGGLAIVQVQGAAVGYLAVAPIDGPAQLWRFDPFDGSQAQVGTIVGPAGPVGVIVGLAALPCEPCPADLDGDCQASVFDFLLLLGWFDAGDLRADIDGNGRLEIFDFLAFLGIFEAGC